MTSRIRTSTFCSRPLPYFTPKTPSTLQIKKHDSVIDSGIDNGAALKLRTTVDEAAANCRAMLYELGQLQEAVALRDKEATPVDQIGTGKSASKKRGTRKWLRLLASLGLGTCVVIGLAIGATKLC